MCIIIDASKFGDFLKKNNAEMAPVHKWLEQPKSRIAYSRIPKLKAEFNRSTRMMEHINNMRENNKLNLVDKEKVEAKKRELDAKGILRSDDSHVMALALVADVKVLIAGDKKLCRDFENLANGNIYKNENDSDLLTPDLCP